MYCNYKWKGNYHWRMKTQNVPKWSENIIFGFNFNRSCDCKTSGKYTHVHHSYPVFAYRWIVTASLKGVFMLPTFLCEECLKCGSILLLHPQSVHLKWNASLQIKKMHKISNALAAALLICITILTFFNVLYECCFQVVPLLH